MNKVASIEQLGKIENLPTDLMTEIKPPSEVKNPGDSFGPSIVSDSEINSTNSHIDNSINTGFSDGPNVPNIPNISEPFPKQGTQLGNVVGGKMVTDLFDTVFPSLCIWAISAIGYSVPKGKLQLTAKEKEMIAPAMQAYLDSININFNNPFYNLLFVIGCVYGSKAIDIIPELKQVSKRSVKASEVVPGETFVKKDKEELIQEIMKTRKKTRKDAETYFNKYYKQVA